MALGNISFTPHLVTLFVEHERLINDAIVESCGLSTTDYCILRALYLCGGSASGVEFAKFLLLKPNSVSTALNRLQSRGFVTREVDSSDGRAMVTRVTPEGNAAVHEATSKTYVALKETFWRDFTDDDIVRAVNVSRQVMGSFGADMSIAPVERTHGHTPLLPEFISGVKHVVQKWTALLSTQYGLSLSEYRIMAMAAAKNDAPRASEVARQLFLAPSAVSVLKSGLVSRELMTVSGPRGRGSLLGCTPKGAKLCAEATQALGAATVECYEDLDEETTLYLDEWHTRMYRILMSSARLAR